MLSGGSAALIAAPEFCIAVTLLGYACLNDSGPLLAQPRVGGAKRGKGGLPPMNEAHTEPAWPLGIRFAVCAIFRALRAPGDGCPSLRAASGPRNQLLGAARPGRAAQQHSALGPIWAFLGHTSPRGVVIWRFSNWRLAQGTSWAERTNSRCPQRFSAPRSRRDGPTADLLHCA